jgi:hypothetical protein
MTPNNETNHGPAPVHHLVGPVCNCGEAAIKGIMFTNFNHGAWAAICDRCLQHHYEMAQDTNDHEMRHFGGSFGLVTWEERDIDSAIQDPETGHLSWPNARVDRAGASDAGQAQKPIVAGSESNDLLDATISKEAKP